MSRDERLSRFAASCGGSSGHKELSECQVCGHLEWQCTRTREPDGYSVSPREYGCPVCAEAFMRAPEVVQWVMAALSKVEEDMAARAASSGVSKSAGRMLGAAAKDASEASEPDSQNLSAGEARKP
jgi:hypothetical protein